MGHQLSIPQTSGVPGEGRLQIPVGTQRKHLYEDAWTVRCNPSLGHPHIIAAAQMCWMLRGRQLTARSMLPDC
jgi:hypothetical protein